MRGSVRALLSVRFSAISASRNELTLLVKMSIPPVSMACRPSSPPRTCSEARCFAPGSVSRSEPLGKSKAARLCRPANLAPGVRQCKRPASIKCSTSHRLSYTPMAIRLPIRRGWRTIWPSTSVRGGSTERSRKGLANRICWTGCATIRGSSALIYVGSNRRQFRHIQYLASGNRAFATALYKIEHGQRSDGQVVVGCQIF